MLFQIRHTTRFKYEQPAYESHNELRMRPLEGPRQRCISFGLEIDPVGAILEYQDFYGNSVHALSVIRRTPRSRSWRNRSSSDCPKATRPPVR